jgi:CubicO group peptidase (beta-lactamase class C family)
MTKGHVLLGFLVLTFMAYASSLAQDARQTPPYCGAPVATEDGWSIATPADAGFDPAALCQWAERRIATPRDNIHAVLVVRHGKLVFEQYFTGDDERGGRPLGQVTYDQTRLHDLRSVSKTVTALLVGIALAQQQLASLDQPIFDFLPQYADLRTPDKARITLRHLLTMSMGLDWDETRTPYTDPNNSAVRMIRAVDPYRYVLAEPVVTPPGAKYNYSSGSTELLGAILHKATGQRLDELARTVLFAPLGIVDFEWIRNADGNAAASWGLRLRPRDMAKLGQLVLAHGLWQGRQIVPRAYLDEVTSPQIQGAGAYFYGYQMWIGRSLVHKREIDWAAGLGLGGQRVIVIPSLDLVVVMTAGLYTNLPLQAMLTSDILNYFILPAVH